MQLEKLVGGGKAGPCLTDMQLKGENEGERTDRAVFLVQLQRQNCHDNQNCFSLRNL